MLSVVGSDQCFWPHVVQACQYVGMKLFGVFALWASVMMALWLLLAIGQAFVDTQPIEWLIWLPPAFGLVHAIAVERDRSG